VTTYNLVILDVAGDYLGTEEWPGAKHNPMILKMWQDAGIEWVTDDETPWCAAFVASVLAQCGLPHTRSGLARSYENYGTAIDPLAAVPGDIVVLWRNSPASTSGHVGFFVRFEGDRVVIRGGNQGNRVSDASYPTNRISAVRRADGRVAAPSRPTLRTGDKGVFVADLQDQLVTLGYLVGRVDAHFGPRTREAVLGFQADHNLMVDGIVGPQTWAALVSASPRPKRVVEMKDLEESRTIKDANKINATAGGVAGVAGVGTVMEVAKTARELSGYESTVQTIGRILVDSWWVLLIFAAAFGIWYFANRIKETRLDDARTGRNLGL
jgi:uncharacterized protein (TIGR02594 family)